MTPAFSFTPHIEKKTLEPIVTSFTNDIVPKSSYRFVKLQNGQTLHEHAIQGLHAIVGKKLPTFIHMSTFIGGNYFPT